MYAVVGQNVRGTYASAGQPVPFRDDGWGANQDGYDTVEWAAAQAWSDGNVGMLDGSYSGFTQYLDCAQCSSPTCGDTKCLKCYNKALTGPAKPAAGGAPLVSNQDEDL